MARPWIGVGDGRHRDVLCADPAVPDTRTKPDNGLASEIVIDARTKPDEGRDPDADPDPTHRPGARGRLLVGDGGHLTRPTRRGAREEGQPLPTRRGRHATGSDPSSPDAIRAAVNADAGRSACSGRRGDAGRACASRGRRRPVRERPPRGRRLGPWSCRRRRAPTRRRSTRPRRGPGCRRRRDARPIDLRTHRPRERARTTSGTGASRRSRAALCSAAGYWLPVVRRTGHAGAVRALFRDADLALVNLEGPAVKDFRWHPHGLVFTFTRRSWRPERGRHRRRDDRQLPHRECRPGWRHRNDPSPRRAGYHPRRRRAGVAPRPRPAWFDIAGQRVVLRLRRGPAGRQRDRETGRRRPRLADYR